MQILFDAPPSSERCNAADTAATRATIDAISTDVPVNRSTNVSGGTEPVGILPSAVDVRTITSPVRDYLGRLSRSANAAAASLACGSILAGHTSETDEYGDVAVWLGDGDYGPGHEREVLAALGLEHTMREGSRVQTVKMSPDTGLPTTVRNSADTTRNPSVGQFRELRGHLTDVRVFSVCADPSVYLLLGRYDSGGQAGFAGLLGLGVQS